MPLLPFPLLIEAPRRIAYQCQSEEPKLESAIKAAAASEPQSAEAESGERSERREPVCTRLPSLGLSVFTPSEPPSAGLGRRQLLSSAGATGADVRAPAALVCACAACVSATIPSDPFRDSARNLLQTGGTSQEP